MMRTLSRPIVVVCLFVALCVSVGQGGAGHREISEAEARQLVSKYLKLPPGAVETSGDMGYPEFYFFMAILGHTEVGGVGHANVRYYAVNRQTGEVWNSNVCQRITSRSLRKLQGALRNEIGLTDTDYRKIKREGPLCEPGMPRARDGK